MQFIILVGPKHSGKTSAGRELQKLLDCGFTDLDELIALQTGKSPRALYAEGPAIFRKAEAEAVGREQGAINNGQKASVLAAGGGIIDNQEAMATIKNIPSATIAYLNVSAETAWERISREDELPPFLIDTGELAIGRDQAKMRHRVLHERRAAAYRQIASVTIEAEGKSPQEIAAEIAQMSRGEFSR